MYTARHGGCLGYFCCGCDKASGKSKLRKERLILALVWGSRPSWCGTQAGRRWPPLNRGPKHSVLVLRWCFLPFSQLRVQAQGVVLPTVHGLSPSRACPHARLLVTTNINYGSGARWSSQHSRGWGRRSVQGQSGVPHGNHAAEKQTTHSVQQNVSPPSSYSAR